ncbi:hypothetical protein J2S55_008917 [Streptosporangium brasiliense]|uniref:Uncharacterized protein n=1 Tax=Streptosporangium brasiliense TaxID=47480 RepID=A0ABT9RK24_9ACTN|nr:hypothetical protein [Streptosporangium brasiliense]
MVDLVTEPGTELDLESPPTSGLERLLGGPAAVLAPRRIRRRPALASSPHELCGA